MRQDGILEEIKSRLDIVDMISDYVALKKAGQNYKGLCPFHSEKTPSFTVSQPKQIFHCFGCGAGGDIVGFLMKHENLTFAEALRVLAKRAGVKLSSHAYGESGERDTLREMQKAALEFFSEGLKRSKETVSYLEGRGIGKEAVKEFSLGYAPKGWHGLYERLKAKGFGEKFMAKSGLVTAGPKGFYDNFRERIMFPIMDAHGEPIAFGGRVMDSPAGESGPKYLNSSDTPIFKKGETLYALNRASEEIRKTGYVLVVEGYLDAIACHQAGFKNAVAPLGTALTQGHLRKLARYAQNVLLVFDGDKAGISAARRSAPIVFEQGLRAKVLLLPEGDDPDSLLRKKNGADTMRELIEAASTPVEFLLKTSTAGKTETVREALGVISKVSDRILMEELVMELSERSGIRETALREEMKRASRALKGERAPLKKQGLAPSDQLTMANKEETLLLNIMLCLPEKAREIASSVSPNEAGSGLLKKALHAVSEGREIDALLEGAGEEEAVTLRRLSLVQGFDPSEVDKNIEDCVRKIRLRSLDAKIREARSKGDLRLLSGLLGERKSFI